jgi:hypothetical protein
VDIDRDGNLSSTYRGHICGRHCKGELVAAHYGLLLGAHKVKSGRRKAIGNYLLQHLGIVTREQNDPVGRAVRPSDLLLGRGRACFGRVGYQ